MRRIFVEESNQIKEWCTFVNSINEGNTLIILEIGGNGMYGVWGNKNITDYEAIDIIAKSKESKSVEIGEAEHYTFDKIKDTYDWDNIDDNIDSIDEHITDFFLTTTDWNLFIPYNGYYDVYYPDENTTKIIRKWIKSGKPIKESLKSFKTGRIMKESIDINKEQVIKITDEIKRKYPSLKKYSEILIAGKDAEWWDADRYAYMNDAYLPTEEEMKDIWNAIELDNIDDWNDWAWTCKLYYHEPFYADCVRSDGYAGTKSKANNSYVFCLR